MTINAIKSYKKESKRVVNTGFRLMIISSGEAGREKMGVRPLGNTQSESKSYLWFWVMSLQVLMSLLKAH